MPPEDDFYLCGSTVTVQRWRGGKGIGPVRKPGGGEEGMRDELFSNGGANEINI